jgi:hypothetical protein
MNWNSIVSFALAGCLTVSTSVSAAAQPPSKGDKGPPSRSGGMSFIASLDANHDRSLSAEEIDKAKEALLKFDQNGDGSLASDEIRAAWSSNRPQAKKPSGPGRSQPQANKGKPRKPDQMRHGKQARQNDNKKKLGANAKHPDRPKSSPSRKSNKPEAKDKKRPEGKGRPGNNRGRHNKEQRKGNGSEKQSPKPSDRT